VNSGWFLNCIWDLSIDGQEDGCDSSPDHTEDIRFWHDKEGFSVWCKLILFVHCSRKSDCVRDLTAQAWVQLQDGQCNF
jgi:hypothetical protein